MEKQPCVYILANKNRTVLYTGVTSNLLKRVWEHKLKLVSGFTSRYNVSDLLYYEQHSTMYSAITREKNVKSWNRRYKERLIATANPNLKDLYPELVTYSNG